jgi:hypothetical protein
MSILPFSNVLVSSGESMLLAFIVSETVIRASFPLFSEGIAPFHHEPS